MALILSKELFGERKIPLGFEVTMTFKSFGYADYREAEARARRLSVEKLRQPEALAFEQKSEEELGPEFQDRLVGLSAEALIDSLVMGFATAWEGVQFEDKSPAPLTAKTWEAFRNEYPLVVDNLDRRLSMPMHMLAQEGNA